MPSQERGSRVRGGMVNCLNDRRPRESKTLGLRDSKTRGLRDSKTRGAAGLSIDGDGLVSILTLIREEALLVEGRRPGVTILVPEEKKSGPAQRHEGAGEGACRIASSCSRRLRRNWGVKVAPQTGMPLQPVHPTHEPNQNSRQGHWH